LIAKVFRVLERADETARAVAGLAMDIADGFAADVRRTKDIALMARSLAGKIS